MNIVLNFGIYSQTRALTTQSTHTHTHTHTQTHYHIPRLRMRTEA